MLLGLSCLIVHAAGCGALRPLRGIPSNYYPAQLEGMPRSGRQTIDLSLLRQTPPEHYLLDSGDVLGVIAEGVLGRPEDVPPVYYPTEKDVPPSLGYPIPVREDGTISLPYAPPLMVRGLTVAQAENLIRETYTVRKQILRPGEDRILVSLQRPRTYSVLVIRQEAQGQELGGQGAQAGSLLPGVLKRGTGKQVQLVAYKNDVLHALAETGGLPGLDAENTIYVIRRTRPGVRDHGPEGTMPYHTSRPMETGVQPVVYTDEWYDLMPEGGAVRQAQAEAEGELVPVPSAAPSPAPPGGFAPLRTAPPPATGYGPAPYPPYGHPPQYPPQPAVPEIPPGMPQEYAATFGRNAEIVRIPIRLHPGETPEFGEHDVILADGDIVFIETRETEVFYTGGLLGGGQYMLPRDYDIDIIEAISIASGRSVGGNGGGGFANPIGGVSSLNQDISVGASDVVILRKTPDGNLIPIRVDLKRADRDPKHRVRILPGDYIVLQYKPHEAVAAFIERNLLAGGIIGLATFQGTGGNN